MHRCPGRSLAPHGGRTMTAPPAADRYLCICADDFGMSEGINAAVLRLAERGKLSATSCMVGRDAWEAGRKALRDIPPAALDVGLHLDLTPIPAGGTSEPGLGALILKSRLGRLDPEGLRTQIRRQLTRFEDGMGRPPAFVDGHRHVHQFAVVREVLTEEIASRYTGAKPWMRNTAPPAPRRFPWTKADLVFALGGARFIEAAARRGIPVSSGLLGVYPFDDRAGGYAERLRRWIAECRTGDVLMCHPSLEDESSTVPHAAARRKEYEALDSMVYPVQTGAGAVFLSPLSRLLPQAPRTPGQSPG